MTPQSASAQPQFDVVCGMDVSGISDVEPFSHKGEKFYFCGLICRARFVKTPDRFLGKPLVELKNIWKTFKIGTTETSALRGLSLRVWEGDFVAIIGASGSGKSSALSIIGLLDRPTAGDIFINGRDAAHFREDERTGFRSETFGFVFQQYNLIPWLTAYENIVLPLLFANKPIDQKYLDEQIEETGLRARLTHRPFELSGGEQQRVALLRAFANNPPIIIGDEPTGNLDSATGNKILDLLIHLNTIHKKTLIIVTHDADIADKADQVITIKDGQMIRNHQKHQKIYTE